MDVYCPACGKKGRIDDARIPDNGIFARCPECKRRLWIHKTDGVSLAREPSSGSPEPGTTQPGSGDPGRPEQPSQAAEPPPSPSPSQPTRQAHSIEPPQPDEPAAAPGPEAGFEISPMPPPRVGPDGASPQPEPPAQGTRCSVCGNVYPDSDIVRFGDTKVCASCKPQYVQMMKSGVSKPGAFTYGGFWIRFVAKVIDWIILGIAQGVIIIPLYLSIFRSASSSPGPEVMATLGTANIFMNIISIGFGAAYTTYFIGRHRATPGKMAFGMKVVLPDGGRVTYWRAFGRHFAEMVSGFTLGIGYIIAGFDSQKRSLHDRICATRVVRS